LKLILFDLGWMRQITRINDPLTGVQVTDDVLGAEAVTGSTNFLRTGSAQGSLLHRPNKKESNNWTYLTFVLVSHFQQRALHDWVNGRRAMTNTSIAVPTAEPLHKIQIPDCVQSNPIAVKEVRHQDEVTIGRELIRYQL
jgi:hypothetical protein